MGITLQFQTILFSLVWLSGWRWRVGLKQWKSLEKAILCRPTWSMILPWWHVLCIFVSCLPRGIGRWEKRMHKHGKEFLYRPTGSMMLSWWHGLLCIFVSCLPSGLVDGEKMHKSAYNHFCSLVGSLPRGIAWSEGEYIGTHMG